MKKKKSNAGRKKEPDKKVQINMFVRGSVIKKHGGKEKTKAVMYKSLEK
jgi:hypothetical protein